MAVVWWLNRSYAPGPLHPVPWRRLAAGVVFAAVSVGLHTWFILWMIWPREYIVRGEDVFPDWWRYPWFATLYGAALSAVVFHGRMLVRGFVHAWHAVRSRPTAAGPVPPDIEPVPPRDLLRCGDGLRAAGGDFLACSAVIAGAVALAIAHVEITDRTPGRPQTEFPLTIEEAQAWEEYSVFGLGPEHDGLPLDAVWHHRGWNETGPRVDNVVALYRGEVRGPVVRVRTSPVCTARRPPADAMTAGAGARVRVLGAQRTVIWTGDVYILVEHEPARDEDTADLLAALQPLNGKARALSGWPAPAAC
jgi:hypothetical protein